MFVFYMGLPHRVALIADIEKALMVSVDKGDRNVLRFFVDC